MKAKDKRLSLGRLKKLKPPEWAILKLKSRHPDVFKRTQNKLTLQYSAVLIAFLILFIASVFTLLYFLLISQQKEELSKWINDRAFQFHESMEHTGDYNFANNLESSYISDSGQMIAFLITSDGQQVFGENTSAELCNSFASAVSGWKPAGEQTKYKTVYLEESYEKGRKHEGLPLSQTSRPDPPDWNNPKETHKARMLIAAKEVYDNGTLLGTLYVGKDVTSQYSLFKLLFIVLMVFAVLFCVLAVFLSRKMAVRAMIPIRAAYTRQREFVADASHELRTPLSVIQASIDTLEMDDQLEEDAFSRKVLGHMKEESKRMTSLLGSMLTLARSDYDTLRLNLMPADLTIIGEQTVDSLLPLAKAKSITLRLSAPDRCIVQADPDRIKQLMLILLDNALKYTPDGGEVVLSLAFKEDKRTLFLSVQDNGIGIPEDEQKRIFERFYRVDKSRTREMGGHGLGLSIAQWITETHGGHITVTSSPGQGSTFTASIPVTNIER